MKRISRLFYTNISVVVLAMSSAIRAQAETPREELVHAYVLLSHANSDYRGHRVGAMNALEVAGKDLGLVLKGDASGNELQLKSDEQLVAARQLLVHAREKLEDRDRVRVAVRLETAIKEIDAALKSVPPAPPRGPAIRVETPREELVHAYVLLSHANADYHGHRLVAMSAIEAAGKDLGLALKGDASGDELQRKSDEQLAAARALLVHAREKLEERDRVRIAVRLETAIKEIDAALKSVAPVPPRGPAIRVETPREELVHAYVLLSHANADYKGHRLVAMSAIEAAGKDLGLVLRGDATADENQLKSDEQLVAARGLLLHAREKLEERDRVRVAVRIETAIKEINAALKVN